MNRLRRNLLVLAASAAMTLTGIAHAQEVLRVATTVSTWRPAS